MDDKENQQFSSWTNIPRSPLLMKSIFTPEPDEIKNFRFSESDNSLFSSSTDNSSEETVTKLRNAAMSSQASSLTPTIFSSLSYDANPFSARSYEGNQQYRNYPLSELGVIGQSLPGPPPSPAAILGLQSKQELLLELVNRTKYNMVQRNGQRSYGGPPPNWIGPPPPKGCEVFVGKIPRDIYEDELVPLFERVGKIYELRLMMDFSGTNRGFCFVCFTTTDEAAAAIRELDNFEIRPGKFIGVVPSVDNRKLWITGVPINATAEMIKADLQRLTEGLTNVYLYPPCYKLSMRTHCIAEYENHRAAALARRRLVPGGVLVLGAEIEVDWAEPDKMIDELLMAKVKVLFVKSIQPQITEDILWNFFNKLSNNQVERVKKCNHYAFVHFLTREGAENALRASNEFIARGFFKFEVTWSKPADKQVATRRQVMQRGRQNSFGSIPAYNDFNIMPQGNYAGHFDTASMMPPQAQSYGMNVHNGLRFGMNSSQPNGSPQDYDFLNLAEMKSQSDLDKLVNGVYGMIPTNRF